MKKCLIGIIMFLTLGLPLFAGLDTEYEAATDGTAAIVMGPNTDRNGQLVVKEIDARHDNNGTLKFYAKGGQGRIAPSAMAGTTVTVSSVAGYAASDDVVYYDTSADTAYYRTIASTTATEIVLSSAVVVTWAVGDQLYEITQQGQLDLQGSRISTVAVAVPGADTATYYGVTNGLVLYDPATNVFVTNTVGQIVVAVGAAGSTSYLSLTNQAALYYKTGDYLFVTPIDSPLYAIADITGGTFSNVTLQITADRGLRKGGTR